MRKPRWNPNSDTLEPDRPQHDRPHPLRPLISALSFSKENIQRAFKKCCYFIFPLLKKCHKSETVQAGGIISEIKLTVTHCCCWPRFWEGAGAAACGRWPYSRHFGDTYWKWGQKLPPKQRQYVSPPHGVNTPTQTPVLLWSRHSFAAVTIGWGTDYPGFESLQRKDIYFSSRTSILALGPIQPPMESVPGFFPGGKAVGAWSWPLTSICCGD